MRPGWNGSRIAPSRSCSPTATSSPARARSAPGSSSIAGGGARVVRDGETIATLGPGDFFGELSVLDGQPRMAAGHRRRRDDLPRARELGPRGGHQRAAIRRPRAAARAGRAPSGADRSRPTLTTTRRRRHVRHAWPVRPADRDRDVPVQRHRGLDAPRARRRHGAVPRHPRAPPGAPAGGVRGARRARAGHRGRLVLRDLPERARRGRGRGRRATRDRRPNPGRTAVAVRVRMGLHTGDIESTGADVIGYAINRTARIAAVAHGGQVLLSDTTRALVAGTLPDGVTPARPRRAPAQGPARPGAPGPARHRRPARRLPAAAVARRPTEQPADAAHDVRRAGARSSARPSRCSAAPGC